MQFTDAEIKRIARQRSDGCSTRYNQIKRELETYNESITTDPEPEEPPEMSEQHSIFFLPPHPAGMTPEVIFVRRFFAWSFSIMFFLIVAFVIWATIAGI